MKNLLKKEVYAGENSSSSHPLSFLYTKESTILIILSLCTFASGSLGICLYLKVFLDFLFLLPSTHSEFFGFVTHGPSDPFFAMVSLLWVLTLWVCLPSVSWMVLEVFHPGLLVGEAKKVHALWVLVFLLWMGFTLVLLSLVGPLSLWLHMMYGTDGLQPGFLPLFRGLTWVQTFCTLIHFLGVSCLGITVFFLYGPNLESLSVGSLKNTRMSLSVSLLLILSLVVPVPDVFGSLLGVWFLVLVLCELVFLCVLWKTLWKKTVQKSLITL